MILALLTTATAAEPSPEVIVWSNAFARFDDRRWVVRTEIVTPSPVQVGTEDGAVLVNAWQLEAGLHCELSPGGRNVREALCTIEAVSLRAHVPGADRGVADTIRAAADELRGAVLQLQVSAKGRVRNVDLEGMPDKTVSARRLEASRLALAGPLAAAFHEELFQRQPGERWQSTNERTLLIASPYPGMGVSRVDWSLDILDAVWVAQASGRATSTFEITNAEQTCRMSSVEDRQTADLTSWEQDRDILDAVLGLPTKNGSSTFVGGALVPGDAGTTGPDIGGGLPVLESTTSALRARTPKWQQFPACGLGRIDSVETQDVQAHYALEMAGVSVVDPERGYATERVWSVWGEPTASTPIAMTYWSAGRLQEVDAIPELPSSGLVGPPGARGGPAAWSGGATETRQGDPDEAP
ncbi:MAG: hypothetical protein R3F61_29685 [Myxococcota bacterium]